ncbi:dTDP-glucose 4,6-dehydratase [Brumimicrobium aurantiacum]|uniref:dTDP-glucose 4,6-dehydratase n=1 Tax=Brumimicrobium aurantiacum TaxID=1737063 RepID=A0A3E1EYR9_9FLAO|nr:dTDP-glucose 4,6-dehydratase [Brumimicrobium aurantiacum]RFC54710.1 dTDP-glucose 4,6-dehydratase [Brumimicrobium aurantiacum]
MNKEKFKKVVLITGGAGFIGSHVVKIMVRRYPEYHIINYDKLTYAGNLETLKEIESEENYTFFKGDICSESDLKEVFSKYDISDVIHLAAESHVDRSISGPMEFVLSNVVGTVNLMNVCRENWSDLNNHVFYHISTDEVYGSLGEEGLFEETTPYDPRSPYSASKASSDHFVRAYHHTYGLNIRISNCSNNYGSFQFPEKLIPLMIHNAVEGKDLPIYGDGLNIRDWLWVEDHANAIDLIFHKGKNGETYNIGGLNEWTNIDLVKRLAAIIDQRLERPEGTTAKQIKFIKDRAGHDRRYAIDASKLEKELGWKPSITFEEGLENTVDWYLTQQKWVQGVISGEYQTYYEKQYN